MLSWSTCMYVAFMPTSLKSIQLYAAWIESNSASWWARAKILKVNLRNFRMRKLIPKSNNVLSVREWLTCDSHLWKLTAMIWSQKSGAVPKSWILFILWSIVSSGLLQADDLNGKEKMRRGAGRTSKESLKEPGLALNRKKSRLQEAWA